MFNWMNRRLYHAIRIWFRIFGVALSILGAMAAFGYGIRLINDAYGQTAGLIAFFALLLNFVIGFVSWMHTDIDLIDDKRFVQKYSKQVCQQKRPTRPQISRETC